MVEAEVFRAAANVANQTLYRSIRKNARQDVFNGLKIVGREVLIEQKKEDTGHLKVTILIGAEYVAEVDRCVEWRPDVVWT